MRRVQNRYAWPVLILILAACSPQGETRAPDQDAEDQVSVQDPTSAVDGYYTAFNAGDVQALETVLSEDLAVRVNFLGQENTSTGRDTYLHQEQASFAAGAQVSYSNPRISGKTFQAEHSYESEGLLLSGMVEFVVEGGQIVSIDIQITQSGTFDDFSERQQEPVGTPIGPDTKLAALGPGWTALAPGGETSCALGTPYSFWVRPGSSKELLIHLQGGGYCDSAENCAPGSFFYDSEVAANDSPVIHPTGIFDLDNPENPFGDHSMVFIPYCTGDTHMGGNVEVYAAEDGTELTVHHVGYANVSSALDWIYDNFDGPDTIFLSGCSAGSAGSVMHAAGILERYPDAELRQVGDSLAMVLERPLDLQTHWKARDNFPEWVEGMSDLQQRDFEMSEFYSLVAKHYPDASFGQVNTLNDAVQVLTYIDFGGDAENWEARLDASLSSIHANAPNFRSLTLGGSEHCMLDRDLFYTYTVDGVRMRDWVADYAAGLDVPSLRCSECDEPELVE